LNKNTPKKFWYFLTIAFLTSFLVVFFAVTFYKQASINIDTREQRLVLAQRLINADYITWLIANEKLPEELAANAEAIEESLADPAGWMRGGISFKKHGASSAIPHILFYIHGTDKVPPSTCEARTISVIPGCVVQEEISGEQVCVVHLNNGLDKFPAVLNHEIGHCLGFAHTRKQTDIMSLQPHKRNINYPSEREIEYLKTLKEQKTAHNDEPFLSLFFQSFLVNNRSSLNHNERAFYLTK